MKLTTEAGAAISNLCTCDQNSIRLHGNSSSTRLCRSVHPYPLQDMRWLVGMCNKLTRHSFTVLLQDAGWEQIHGLTLRTFSRSASAVYRYNIQHKKTCTPTMNGGVKVKASCAWLRNWALCSPRDSDAPMTNIMTPILSRKAWYSSFKRMLSFL